MKKSVAFSVVLFLAPVFIGIAWANDDVIVNPEAAEIFATLPADLRFPEGITANPSNGDVYVGNFDGGVANSIVRFDSNGGFVARADLGITPLLDLAFNSRDNMVYFCSVGDFTGGSSKIRRIAADLSGPVEDVAFIPSVGAPPNRIVGNPDGSEDEIIFGNNARVPNALTINSRGDIFVSDSFQGAVFRINRADSCKTPCKVKTVAHDGLLATAGFPAFGANGVALSDDERTLFVANTGDDRILTVDLKKGDVSVFVESINGADGIAFDAAGNLVVAANQADNVLILDSNTGRIKAKLGDFLGITGGKVNGLLFPASVVVVGSDIFVTNLALPLRGTPDEPEASSALTTYTVSKIRIPAGL